MVYNRFDLSWWETTSAVHFPRCLRRALGSVDRTPNKSSAPARAFNGPSLAALVARVRDDVPDVPPHEQWLSTGAALMNFLNPLHLMGFGAKALSGASVSDPAVYQAFCGTGERLASWVIAGRPTRAPHPKGDEAARPAISDWRPGLADRANLAQG